MAMTAKLWTWLVGYLVVRFRGPYVERALNAAAQDGIPCWGIERLTTDIVITRLSVRHFRRLRPILRTYGVGAAIFERQGLPFVLNRLRKRLFFIVGLLVVSLGILYLSSFVWFIEVTGSDRIRADEILNAAVAHGLFSGLPRRALNEAALEAALMSQFPSLAWADIRVEGTRAVIEVVERQPAEYDPSLVGDIVALFGGVVTDVFVARGTALVHPGDEVHPGDVLISGTYYDRWGRKQQGRAQGAVWARTWRESFAEVPLYESYQWDTGEVHSQMLLKLGKYTIPLGLNSPFSAYRTEVRIWQLKFGNHELPVQFTQRKFIEVQYEKRLLPRASVEELALEEAWSKLEEQGVERGKVAQVRTAAVEVPDAEALRVILAVLVEQNIGEFREN
ncbi:MAG: sporulation protein YqfD [Firmicutes bacterium]|nr:sporulation protein YqfD [Bacillota bacterium]